MTVQSDGSPGSEAGASPVPPSADTSVSGATGPKGDRDPSGAVVDPRAKTGKQVVLAAGDSEFLPAALEILVTPPSPIALWLMGLICALVFSGIAWGYFGWLDIIVVAPGKIQPSGYTKVVQPVEPGKVVAVWVKNGSRVNAGDVLIELDPTEPAADQEAIARDLDAAGAEAARRKAAIAMAVRDTSQLAARETSKETPIEFDKNTTESVRQRERVVLAADHAQLLTSINSLKAQLSEKQATQQRLKLSMDARQKLIALNRERVSMREELANMGAGSRALIMDAEQQLETQLTTDANEHGELLETDAAIKSIDRKIEVAVTQFVADQAQKLSEVERKRDHLEQDLIKARSKRERTRLTAPIDGTVAQLGVTTIGQVVTSGQALLNVVPLDGPIEVEAMIANKDIGFVKPEQLAAVKVEAFPFTHYGTIEGHIVNISRDAVDDREATSMTDASTATRVKSDTSSPISRMQNLVYPATLRLDQRTIMVDGKEIPLSAGMVVSVEIKTGRRRAIDYVLSPLSEVTSQTARER